MAFFIPELAPFLYGKAWFKQNNKNKAPFPVILSKPVLSLPKYRREGKVSALRTERVGYLCRLVQFVSSEKSSFPSPWTCFRVAPTFKLELGGMPKPVRHDEATESTKTSVLIGAIRVKWKKLLSCHIELSPWACRRGSRRKGKVSEGWKVAISEIVPLRACAERSRSRTLGVSFWWDAIRVHYRWAEEIENYTLKKVFFFISVF